MLELQPPLTNAAPIIVNLLTLVLFKNKTSADRSLIIIYLDNNSAVCIDLARLFNRCFDEQCLLGDLKVARVKPLRVEKKISAETIDQSHFFLNQ